MIPLGPFRSNLDFADTNEGVLAYVVNASLMRDGNGVAYGPLAGFTPFSDPGIFVAIGAVKGTLTCVTAAGAYVSFVMTATNIYRVGGDGSFTSIGSGYTLPAGDRWGACQFGSKAVFTNKSDGMLQYDIELLSGSPTLISTAPKARIIGVVFDSLFALDCDGDNKMMRYSSINDHTKWSGGTSNYQPMPDGEELLGIAEVTDGTALVIQKNGIRVLYRNDSTLLFSMRKPISEKGAINPWCIVPVNGGVYFADIDGFKFATLEGLQSIGRGKADKYWLNDLTTDGLLATMIGAYDPTREAIRWLYKQNDSDDDDLGYSGLIDFDITTQEFVPVRIPEVPPEPDDVTQTTITGRFVCIFTTATPGYTMEELDAFGTMDALDPNLSLDDRFWYGGIPQLGAIILAQNADSGDFYYFGFFAGDTLEAIFETNTMTLGRRTDILEVTPITDSAEIEVEIGAKDRLSDDIVYEAAATPDEDGIVPVYTAGRYMRLRSTIPADTDWTYFRGFEDFPTPPVPGGRG